jgi:hypothetical protein
VLWADDLHSNLHGKIGKTALPKVLASLVSADKVTQKAYGKQVVFVVKQVRPRASACVCARVRRRSGAPTPGAGAGRTTWRRRRRPSWTRWTTSLTRASRSSRRSRPTPKSWQAVQPQSGAREGHGRTAITAHVVAMHRGRQADQLDDGGADAGPPGPATGRGPHHTPRPRPKVGSQGGAAHPSECPQRCTPQDAALGRQHGPAGRR